MIPQNYPLYVVTVVHQEGGERVCPPSLVVAWRPVTGDPDFLTPCVVRYGEYDVLAVFADEFGPERSFTYFLDPGDANDMYGTLRRRYEQVG